MKCVWIIVISLCLAACGGGTGTAAPPSTVSGTAATGAGIAGRIFVKDVTGRERFVDTTSGSFTLSVDGLSAPFLLRASWQAAGATRTMYSFATAPGIANITPLTDLALGVAGGGTSLEALYASPSPGACAAIAAALPAAIAALRAGLAPLLEKFSVASADPFATSFVADHTGMDALLDSITVTLSAGAAVVADATTGALLLEATLVDPAHALVMPAWAPADAAVASDPDIAVDAAGNGLVVWANWATAGGAIQARFVTQPGSAVVTLSTAGSGIGPRVAFDAAGDAWVTWAQWQNNRNSAWVRRYSAARRAWDQPLQLSTANAAGDAAAPELAVDGAGNVLVVWSQGNGQVNHGDVWFAAYSASTTSWSAPALVSDGVNSAYGSVVAVNAAGQGIVAWRQEQGDGTTVSNAPTDVWARRFDSAGNWGTAATINSIPATQLFVYGQLAVALDGAGNGVALWIQGAVQAAILSATGGWQPSQRIVSDPSHSAYGPHAAFDAAGNAIAVWQEQDGFSAFGGTSRYVAGDGWAASSRFLAPGAGDVYLPRVAVDGAGNATAVWYQAIPGGLATIYCSRFVAAGGRGPVSPLSPTGTDGFMLYPVPVVAANAAGLTLAVWGTNSN